MTHEDIRLFQIGINKKGTPDFYPSFKEASAVCAKIGAELVQYNEDMGFEPMVAVISEAMLREFEERGEDILETGFTTEVEVDGVLYEFEIPTI